MHMSGKKCLYYKSYFFLRWQRERSNTYKICSISATFTPHANCSSNTRTYFTAENSFEV